MKWEYRVEWATVGQYFDEFVEMRCKALGHQGWELVHMLHWQEGAGFHVKGYFKRAVEADRQVDDRA